MLVSLVVSACLLMYVDREEDSKALCSAHTDALLPFIQSVCVGEVDYKLQLLEKSRVAIGTHLNTTKVTSSSMIGSQMRVHRVGMLGREG